MENMFTVPDMARRQSETVGAKRHVARYADTYRTCNQLGKGGFGTVKACVHIEEGEEYAVKVVVKVAHSTVHHEVEILQVCLLLYCGVGVGKERT